MYPAELTWQLELIAVDGLVTHGGSRCSRRAAAGILGVVPFSLFLLFWSSSSQRRYSAKDVLMLANFSLMLR